MRIDAHPFSYRIDAKVRRFPDDRPIIFFDGNCVLCSRFAQWVIAQDTQARFRLAAAQTPLGQELYRHYHLDPVNFETNLVIAEGRPHAKLEALAAVLARLPKPWPWLSFIRYLPQPIADWLYDRVARNRFALFGRRETCLLRLPGANDRFLE